jgi:two-component system, NarL family, sensor kinase
LVAVVGPTYRGGVQNAAPPSVASAVTRFVLGSLIAISVIVIGAFFALRGVAIAEATRDTRERVGAEGRLVEAAGLSEGILTGDPAAIAEMDDLVTHKVLSDSIVRVKLWTEDGRILYSDDRRLIGSRFPLGDEERALFSRGGSDAELSDLEKSENQYERPEGKLLEAHTVVHAPDGTPLLFEIYQRFSSISASGARLLGTLAPPLIGGVVVLLLLQVPLAWTMARRLQRGSREREALLVNAVDASTRERQQIASALHDGVVQDLAGVAFGLAPLTAGAQRRGDHADAQVLDDATRRLRQGVRDLRSLLVEIHPPNLETAGLRVALSDLLSPLEAEGISTSLQVDDAAAGIPSSDATLLYRVAREAIRNAREHGRPSAVEVTVIRTSDTVLVVTDDGVGFSPDDRLRRKTEGHFGLTLLESIVDQVGGTLDVASAPGSGTTITLTLPPR